MTAMLVVDIAGCGIVIFIHRRKVAQAMYRFFKLSWEVIVGLPKNFRDDHVNKPQEAQSDWVAQQSAADTPI